MAACEKLKGKGIAPVGGGIQDGYWGEWYFGHALAQNLDSAGEAIDLFTGVRDFQDPKYHEHWVKLEELKKAGFLNDEMSSTELYPGIDLIVAGKVGAGPSIGSRMPADSKATQGRIGAMVMPAYGQGKLAGQPIMDCQGLGLPAKIADPAGGGGVPDLPAVARAPPGAARHDRLDPGQHQLRHLGDPGRVGPRHVAGLGLAPNVPYLANLVPGQFYEQALLPAAQQVVQGEITGAQAGELAAKVAKEWREFNPDIVENYQKWAADLAG